VVLKNKISLITGAARGIGKSIAIEFCKEGSTVFINDIDSNILDKTQQDIRKLGFDCHICKADVSKSSDVCEMFANILSSFGKIDILVNNAGIIKDSTIHKMTEEQWDQVIKINLKGVFNCSKEAVIAMRKEDYGRIINISSVIGLRGNFGQTNYAASKAGIIGFSKSLAFETARKGITVNAIAPGFIETEMTKKIPQDILENCISTIPMGRMGKPRDIARLTVYLASDDADYITGQVFVVDGGYYMR